jgi:hypothetical protein
MLHEIIIDFVVEIFAGLLEVGCSLFSFKKKKGRKK